MGAHQKHDERHHLEKNAEEHSAIGERKEAIIVLPACQPVKD